ncbi:MAG: type II secretion system secretin GspD [Pseudomonadota bacterium]
MTNLSEGAGGALSGSLTRSLLWLALGLSLFACASPRGSENAPTSAIEEPASLRALRQMPSADRNNAVDEFGLADGGRRSTIEQGSGRRLGTASNTASIKLSDDGPDVILQLVDAPIAEAARTIISETLDGNFVIQDGVSGQVTLQTGRPIPRTALLPLLDAVLRPQGAAIIAERDIFRIVPIEEAAQTAPRVTTARSSVPPGFSVRIEQLNFVAASEMKQVLDTIAPPNGVLFIDDPRNILILAGTQAELSAMLETIRLFDVDWLTGMSFGIFEVRSTAPDDIVADLEAIFATPEGSAFDGVVRLIPSNRLGAIIAVSPQAKHLERVRTWIERLDITEGAETRQLFVYNVQHGQAETIAALLQDVFNFTVDRPTDSTFGSSVAPSREEVEIAARASAFPAAPRTRSDRDQALALLQGSVRIVSYPEKNSLLIVGTPSEHEQVLDVLSKIDVPSNQVLLEATIAEVELQDSLEYGLQWFFREGDGTFAFPQSATDGFSAPATAFSFTFNRSSDLRVALNALASITNVKVLSSPSLMVMDNQTATLTVGDEVPIVSQQIGSVNATSGSQTGDTTTLLNSVEQRSTGVLLQITPRVSNTGIVQLEILQEVSDAVQTVTSGIDSPTIQTRNIETVVAVRDGESLALGGLIEEDETRNYSGIPFISRVPLLGNLFRNQSTSVTRSELLIIITPRVVRSAEEARTVTEELRGRLEGLRPVYDTPN